MNQPTHIQPDRPRQRRTVLPAAGLAEPVRLPRADAAAPSSLIGPLAAATVPT
jgi:hypothetical protein